MILKRSFFFYLIIAIILLRLNLNVIHRYRLGYLRHVYLVPGKGKDIPAAIVYYDYLSRVDPTDIQAWSGLINAYLADNDVPNAHQSAIRALKITPKDSVNYPTLMSFYNHLLEQYPIK